MNGSDEEEEDEDEESVVNIKGTEFNLKEVSKDANVDEEGSDSEDDDHDSDQEDDQGKMFLFIFYRYSLRRGRRNNRCIFVMGISLTKAFPIAQIRPNLHKIVSSCWERFYASLDKSVLQGMLL